MVCQVILSACSNTFKSILKETQAPHPVIVLWDIEARDVSALLDFMYNGQVLHSISFQKFGAKESLLAVVLSK